MRTKLTLIGSGPGDPELITVKGLKALMKADAVLYDALAAEELLEYAPPKALKLFVGKRAGRHSCPQNKIHALILRLSGEGKQIVRLKGGDPTVFGRAYEEVRFALSHGLDVEIIPGISSAVAGPAAAWIPLTMRGLNESFWVITATTALHKLSTDIEHAARSSATVVILMGLNQIEQIVACFKRLRGDGEPICLVENCSTKHQKHVSGDLDGILQKLKADPVGSPAVIIIGKTVKEQEKLAALRNNLMANYKICIA